MAGKMLPTAGVRWLLLAVFAGGVFFYAVWRDIRFEKAYTGDLRNRITGARMVRDGRSPYFYKWSPGDGLRYYDPGNFDSVRPSNMTSTPILYRLLSPLADLPQSTISVVWLVIEYFILTVITGLAMGRARTPLQRQAVLGVSALLLLSNGWKEHVANGQTYLLVPLFGMLFLVFLEKGFYPGARPAVNGHPGTRAAREGHPAWAIAAGVAAACLVGTRLNTVLFFVPFLPMARFLSRRWMGCFFLPIALAAGCILSGGHERLLWQDYFANVREAIKTNQRLDPPIVHNAPDPQYPRWEGIDTAETARAMRTPPATIHSENGNFFVVFKQLTHCGLSVAMLGWLAVGLCALFAGGYFLRRGGTIAGDPAGPAAAYSLTRTDVSIAAVFGVCLFMIPDLFSPIYRHQYYTVQWFLPLLLAASFFDQRRKTGYALMLAGLLFWCIPLSFLKMENTLGEYAIMAVLLGFSVFPGRKKASKTGPASLPKSR